MEEQKEQEPKKGLLAGLNIPQILAGALSAITVAFALSSLGVSGTLIGAGVGSILGAFGTTLYTQTLDKSTVIVKKVARPVAAHRSQASDKDTELVLAPATSAALSDSGEASMSPSIHDTQEIPPVTLPPEGDGENDGDQEERQKTEENGVLPWYRRLNWKSIVVLAAVSLALALAVVSLYEVKTGNSLSGERGTTIERVVVYRDNPAGAIEPEPTPTPTVIYIIEDDEEGDAPETNPVGKPENKNNQTDGSQSQTPSHQYENSEDVTSPNQSGKGAITDKPKTDSSSGTTKPPAQNPPAVKEPVAPVEPPAQPEPVDGDDGSETEPGTSVPAPTPSPTPTAPPADGSAGNSKTAPSAN